MNIQTPTTKATRKDLALFQCQDCRTVYRFPSKFLQMDGMIPFDETEVIRAEPDWDVAFTWVDAVDVVNNVAFCPLCRAPLVYCHDRLNHAYLDWKNRHRDKLLPVGYSQFIDFLLELYAWAEKLDIDSLSSLTKHSN